MKSLRQLLTEAIYGHSAVREARKPRSTAHRPLPGGQSTERGPLPGRDSEEEHRRPLSDLSEAGQTLGRSGGKRGGPARAKVLSPARRREIASEGGRAAHGKD